MLGLAVVLVLATFGNEGTREERFRGSLIAQASAPSSIDRVAIQRELDRLVLEKPDFVPAATTLAIGGAFTLLGLTSLVIMAAAGVSSSAGIIFLVIGAATIPTGLIVALVAGLVMINVAVDRRVFDERIQLLRGKLAQPVELPPPPPGVMAPAPALMLARF